MHDGMGGSSVTRSEWRLAHAVALLADALSRMEQAVLTGDDSYVLEAQELRKRATQELLEHIDLQKDALAINDRERANDPVHPVRP